jgi:hypothetical protein
MADVIAPGAPEPNCSVSLASPSLSSENHESITQTQESHIDGGNPRLEVMQYIVKSEIDYLARHLQQINHLRKERNQGRFFKKTIGVMYGFTGNIITSTRSHTKKSRRPRLTRPSYLERSIVWIPDILLSHSVQDLSLRSSHSEYQCRPLGPHAEIIAWCSQNPDAEKTLKPGRPLGSISSNGCKVVERFFDIEARHFLEDSFQPPRVMTPCDEAAIQDLASDDQILRGDSLETHKIFRFRDVPIIDQSGFVSGTCARTGSDIKFLWADHPHKVIICDTQSTWEQAYSVVVKDSVFETQFDKRLEELKQQESFGKADPPTQVIFPRMSLKLLLNTIALNVICIFCLPA